MCKAIIMFRVLALQAFAACALCSLGSAALSDTVVAQGGRVTMPPTGSAAPGTGLSWDIVLGTTTVASSQSAKLWAAAYSVTTHEITVHASDSATIATGYTVRIANAATKTNYSAVFDVVLGINSLNFLPNSVVGGGSTTATIQLDSAPKVSTAVSISSNSTKVTFPTTVTIPAGTKSYNFTIRTTSTTSNISAIVSATLGSDRVSAPLMVYANPNLSFKPPLVYPVPSANDSIFAADMNGDGTPDVIIGTSEGWGILYGNGDGTLKPYTNIYNWTAGLFVRAVADLNGDGKPDVVATDTNGNVLIFLNKGGGAFAAPQNYQIKYATGATVADFNNDGHPDLLITSAQPTSYNGGAQILINNGHGAFTFGTSWNPGFFVQGCAHAMLHDQNNIDVVLSGASGSGNRIAIWYGDGKGNFTAGPTTSTGNIDTGNIAIVDLLGTGIPDILVSTWEGGDVAILLGQQNGSFANPVYYSAGAYTSGVQVAYMKGDGQLDIVAGRAGTDNFAVLLNQGGLFGTILQVNTGSADVRSIAIADMNGDGKPDVICQGNSSGTISVLLNNRP